MLNLLGLRRDTNAHEVPRSAGAEGSEHRKATLGVLRMHTVGFWFALGRAGRGASGAKRNTLRRGGIRTGLTEPRNAELVPAFVATRTPMRYRGAQEPEGSEHRKATLGVLPYACGRLWLRSPAELGVERAERSGIRCGEENSHRPREPRNAELVPAFVATRTPMRYRGAQEPKAPSTARPPSAALWMPTVRSGSQKAAQRGASGAKRNCCGEEGFEPSVRLPVHMISSHAPSATRSPLQVI